MCGSLLCVVCCHYCFGVSMFCLGLGSCLVLDLGLLWKCLFAGFLDCFDWVGLALLIWTWGFCLF